MCLGTITCPRACPCAHECTVHTTHSASMQILSAKQGARGSVLHLFNMAGDPSQTLLAIQAASPMHPSYDVAMLPSFPSMLVPIHLKTKVEASCFGFCHFSSNCIMSFIKIIKHISTINMHQLNHIQMQINSRNCMKHTHTLLSTLKPKMHGDFARFYPLNAPRNPMICVNQITISLTCLTTEIKPECTKKR